MGCRGNGKILGLTDGISSYGLEYAYYNTVSYGLQPEKNWQGQDVSATVTTPPAQWAPQGAKLGLARAAVNSGVVADIPDKAIPSRKLGKFYIRY